MKKIVMLLSQILSCAYCYAQNTTRIEMQAGNFFSPQFRNETPFSVPIKSLGILASHVVCNNFSVKLGYQFWVNPFGSSFSGDPFDMVVWSKNQKISTRWNYEMIDIGAMYAVFRKRNQFFADLGMSITTGENIVITSIYQHPGYPDKIFQTETRKAKYTGLKYELGYNYLLFKSRMNAGLSVSSRNYFGKDAFTQYNLNVNFGYNFNLVKRKQPENKE